MGPGPRPGTTGVGGTGPGRRDRRRPLRRRSIPGRPRGPRGSSARPGRVHPARSRTTCGLPVSSDPTRLVRPGSIIATRPRGPWTSARTPASASRPPSRWAAPRPAAATTTAGSVTSIRSRCPVPISRPDVRRPLGSATSIARSTWASRWPGRSSNRPRGAGIGVEPTGSGLTSSGPAMSVGAAVVAAWESPAFVVALVIVVTCGSHRMGSRPGATRAVVTAES